VELISFFGKVGDGEVQHETHVVIAAMTHFSCVCWLLASVKNRDTLFDCPRGRNAQMCIIATAGGEWFAGAVCCLLVVHVGLVWHCADSGRLKVLVISSDLLCQMGRLWTIFKLGLGSIRDMVRMLPLGERSGGRDSAQA
jgi:hypothetical protein